MGKTIDLREHMAKKAQKEQTAIIETEQAEWEGFIDLLRYFMSVNVSKIDEAVITFSKLGMFMITDKSGIPIKSDLEIDTSVFDDEFNIYDLSISSLIYLAPKALIVRYPASLLESEEFMRAWQVFKEAFDNVKMIEYPD